VVSNLVGAPHVVTLEARAETRRLTLMSQALSLFALAPPLLTLGALLLLGREFMALVFGPAFVASAAPLIILTAGRVLQMACGNARSLLIMTGHQRPLLVIDALTALAVVPGSLVAYGLAGINGVAASSSAVMFLGALATATLARRRLGFWPLGVAGVRDLTSHVRCRWLRLDRTVIP
jgi:O-antigen/teichoic acid export membrane protein